MVMSLMNTDNHKFIMEVDVYEEEMLIDKHEC